MATSCHLLGRCNELVTRTCPDEVYIAGNIRSAAHLGRVPGSRVIRQLAASVGDSRGDSLTERKCTGNSLARGLPQNSGASWHAVAGGYMKSGGGAPETSVCRSCIGKCRPPQI